MTAAFRLQTAKKDEAMRQDNGMLGRLVAAIDTMTPEEGVNATYLDNVALFRASEHRDRLPLIYDQSLCIAAQGHKKCHLTDSAFTYGASDMLVVPTIIPVEVEIIPEEDLPLLSMTVLLDFDILRELMDTIRQHDDTALNTLSPSPGLYLETLRNDTIESCLRLLASLQSKSEAEIIGRQVVRELHYRLLMGHSGHILAAAVRGESGYALISKALRTIHDNYGSPIDVPQLAESANMSTRAFYNHFKSVTSHSPVQYLKRIRLEKARQFIVSQGEQASTAAHMVGYESASQFSREFKRHFGYPPREAVRNSRHMAV